MSNKNLVIVLIVSVVLNVVSAGTLIYHWTRVSRIRRRMQNIRELRMKKGEAQKRQHFLDLLSQEEFDSTAIMQAIDRLIDKKAEFEKNRMKRLTRRISKLPTDKRRRLLKAMRQKARKQNDKPLKRNEKHRKNPKAKGGKNDE